MLVHNENLWLGNKIPIDPMLIWRITKFPYQGWNPAEEFAGKDQDHAIAESMKKNFRLVKGKRGYDINLISDQAVHFPVHILAEKLMRTCRANEIPMSVVSLAMQCAKKV